MRRASHVILILLAAPVLAPSQEHVEFAGWMKSVASAWQALGKLDPKTGTEAVHQAEQLGRVYENMIGFWRQRDAPDAVKWSLQGKAAAAQLATSAFSGDAAKADESAKILAGTCRSCHEIYREKLADGRYRIKPPVEPKREPSPRKTQ